MGGAQHLEAGIDAVDGRGPEREHQAAFRAEPLDQRGRGQAGFLGDFGQRQPRRAEPGHGALGGAEDVLVGDGAGARTHA